MGLLVPALFTAWIAIAIVVVALCVSARRTDEEIADADAASAMDFHPAA